MQHGDSRMNRKDAKNAEKLGNKPEEVRALCMMLFARIVGGHARSHSSLQKVALCIAANALRK